MARKQALAASTHLSTLPDVFLRYQQELMAEVEANQVLVVEKSRRTGFSWGMGAVAALTASAARGEGGMDVLYMGYEKEMTREFIEYVATWAQQMGRAAGEVQEFMWTDPDHPEREILAFRIHFASGFEVVALPSVARALRGKQGLVILDEAAFHDDLDGVLKAAFALLIWGGKVVVISTHNGEQNPFNVLVQDIRGGRKPYKLMRVTFDDALADGLYRRICLTTGKEWSPVAEAAWRAEIIAIYAGNEDEELFVIPNPTSGTFLSGPMIEARTRPGVPVLRFECSAEFSLLPEAARRIETAAWIREHLLPALDLCDQSCPHVFGFDIARRGDLSVFWPLSIGRDLVRRTPFLIEMRRVPFAQQQQIIWAAIGGLPRLRRGCMDATGLGMETAEKTIDKFGSIIEAVMLSEPWYRENMPPMKTAFEDAMIEIPADRDTVDDLRMLKLVRGVARIPERRMNDAGQQRHGDAAIACCLANAASRAEPEQFGYEPVPRPGMRPEGVTSSGWSDRPRADQDDRKPERGIMPNMRGTAL